jgi:hypothetical protein
MDILCAKCGEPWDLYTVLHDDPENFERRGSLILACPSCNGKRPKMSHEREEFLRQVAQLAQLCGTDIDGFAGMLEDFGMV